MAKRKKKWSDLTTRQKRAVYVAGALETVATAVAVRDLITRPSAQVRGPKVVWLLASFLQPVGPIAYLAAGRK